MRSNRQSYASAPAGSARALRQKPRPKTSKRVWNSRLLPVFFVALPVLGVLAIFFQPIRWVFMAAVVLSLALMWVTHAFLFPGRMILSAAYGLMFVFTLVTALSAGSPSPTRQPPSFMATAVPTAEPTPMFSASTMGTNVPADYYGTPVPAGDVTVDVSGTEDQSGAQGIETETDTYNPSVKSEAEIALENFMERWRRGVVADMVEYTAESWRAAQQDSSQRDAAAQQLFWKFGQKPLLDWRQISPPTGTEASGARTITVQADINYGGETRTYEYEAIILRENDHWYVDPDSLSSGILKEQATPTPDPDATPTPEPSPTPVPTTDPKLKLYYNKDGGKRYHIDPECPSVDKKFLPLASFNFNQLGRYPDLVPCPKCGAPDRM